MLGVPLLFSSTWQHLLSACSHHPPPMKDAAGLGAGAVPWSNHHPWAWLHASLSSSPPFVPPPNPVQVVLLLQAQCLLHHSPRRLHRWPYRWAAALCTWILSGLKWKSLIKQLPVYNYILNYSRVSLLCCSVFAKSFVTIGGNPYLKQGFFFFSPSLLLHVRDFFWRGLSTTPHEPQIKPLGPRLEDSTPTVVPKAEAGLPPSPPRANIPKTKGKMIQWNRPPALGTSLLATTPWTRVLDTHCGGNAVICGGAFVIGEEHSAAVKLWRQNWRWGWFYCL